MQAWIPMMVMVVTGAIGALEPTVNAWIAAHPTWAPIIYALLGSAAALAKSPLQKPGP